MARMPVRRPMSHGPTPGSAPDPKQPPTVEVPRQNVDPIWSLCPWPITVTKHGHMFEVEPVPALIWLKHLMPAPKQAGNVDFIGLLDELIPEIDDFWFDNRLPPDELFDLALELIDTVGARPWWITLRMLSVASSAWNILGPKMIINNGDPTKLSLAAWLDLLLYLIMDSIEPEKATMFTMQLEAPPAGAVSEEAAESFPATERSAFLAMA